MKNEIRIKLRKIGLLFFWVLISSQFIMAQTGTIKGTVKDQGGALPGANVKIEGTSTGTITNLDGTFVLENVPVGKQTIKVSFIGYASQSETVTVESGITIEQSFTLEESDITTAEIMVTASKRSENIQDVPQSISAITGRGLEQIGATNTRDYINTLPGVRLMSENPANTFITIRGVAPVSGWSATVGYYIDETPVTEFGLQPSVTSFDVERIEVMRGPQGTLYGEGSMGGTIKIIPNKPNVKQYQFKFDPELSSTSNGGINYNVNTMINAPIIKDKLALRATGFYRKDDGYIKNLGIGVDNVNTNETYGGRISARYLATDKLFFTVSGLFGKTALGGTYVANDNFEQNTLVRENRNDYHSIYNLSAYYDMSFANLTVSGSYYTRDIDNVVDLGFLLPEVNGLLGMFGLEPRTSIWTDNTQNFNVYTGEARLVSSGDSPFKWTVGAFYKDYDMSGEIIGDSEEHIPDETVSFIIETITGGAITDVTGTFINNNSRKITQMAGFAELSYNITDQLNVLGGIRVFNEKRDFNSFSGGLFPVLQTMLPPTEVSDKGDETVVNPKFTLAYKPIANINIYATASKGFRSGGQNLFAFMFQGAPTSYEAESLWNYEFGIKSVLLDGKLIANVATFYNDWTNMQLITRSLASLSVVENVGQAHTTGVDAEVTWIPVKGLLFSASGNYTKAVTDVIINLPAGNDPGTGDELFDEVPKGTQLPFVPELGLNFAGQYKFSLSNNMNLIPRVEYNYTAESTNTLLNPEIAPAYSTINLRINLEYKWLDVYCFANNVTDELIQQTFWGEDPILGKTYAVGRPRTIGIGLRTRF